ncbi:MAG: ABC transporter permease subunit [Peptococcaceae bacterium]
MNVFLRELKANLKSLIIWSSGVCLLVVGGMGKYAGLSASGQSMNDLLAQMPESLKAVWGLGSFDLATVGGYYGVLFVYLAVMAAIHAAMLGAIIISKEERDKTAEFLFVKPISRSKIITAKLGAALVNILLFNLATLTSSVMMVQKYSRSEKVMRDMIILMAGMLILQLNF